MRFQVNEMLIKKLNKKKRKFHLWVRFLFFIIYLIIIMCKKIRALQQKKERQTKSLVFLCQQIHY